MKPKSKRNVTAIIPARYKASRFPGKPLALIDGKTMIERVFRQVEQCKTIDRIIVATDDDRIREEVERIGGQCAITRSD
ncbi:MAG TPA: NTP transferase domain-containing protein, partial [Candidatus Obscuribacterales bacterium]